jgi:cephalosporin hydroxylase
MCVNGHYLIVEECNVNQVQEHNLNNYVQGGPAYAVYNLGAKKYEGSISFPLRVDQDGNLEPAARIILEITFLASFGFSSR